MNPTTSTPTTERRARPRCGHVCSSNHCHQGRTPCPTPQACELPDEEPPTALEKAGFAAWLTVLAVVIVAALYASATA